MVGVMQKDCNGHHMTQIPMTENQFEEMQMMEEMAEDVGMNYLDTPDSRYVGRKQNQLKTPSQ